MARVSSCREDKNSYTSVVLHSCFLLYSPGGETHEKCILTSALESGWLYISGVVARSVSGLEWLYIRSVYSYFVHSYSPGGDTQELYLD